MPGIIVHLELANHHIATLGYQHVNTTLSIYGKVIFICSVSFNQVTSTMVVTVICNYITHFTRLFGCFSVL